MAYVKPNPITRRVVDPLVARLKTGGVATLTVPGRRSGRLRTVPLIPVEVEGTTYLVSPFGESAWVRNLRSSGSAELARRGGSQTVRAEEVPPGQRAPIIAAYRKRARRDVDRLFARLPDPSDHPVFRVVAADAAPMRSDRSSAAPQGRNER